KSQAHHYSSSYPTLRSSDLLLRLYASVGGSTNITGRRAARAAGKPPARNSLYAREAPKRITHDNGAGVYFLAPIVEHLGIDPSSQPPHSRSRAWSRCWYRP